jgi:glucokinase
VGDGPPASRHLGIDLGATNVKWTVVERSADGWLALDRGQVPTSASEGPDAVVDRLTGVATDAIRTWPGASTAGVGVPGSYDPVAGATRSLTNIPGDWSGRPVAAEIRALVTRPVFLVNDARAFGLAELRMGAGRGAGCMVGVTLGTGVGGVLALDGRIHHGHDGSAGELGHQVIEPDGPACSCGGRGCLEALVNADRICRDCGTDTVEEAVERARAGDQRAGAGIEAAGRYLGIGIANVVSILTPDRIVIGGGIAAALDLLMAPIWRELRDRVHLTPLERIEIVPAQLGIWAGAIGAAIHAAEAA